MNIFERKNRNQIEGINIRDFETILDNLYDEHLPRVDTIIFDTILLTDDTKIKCVKNYYATFSGATPKKGRANNTCVAIQKFFDIGCRPYDCVRCHKNMLYMRSNKQVKPR